VIVLMRLIIGQASSARREEMANEFESCQHPSVLSGHENKDLLSEAINGFRLIDILKLWEAVHLPWEAVPER
jgi:hypothetical protein